MLDLLLSSVLVNATVNPSSIVTAGSIYTENTVTVLIEILVVLAISMQIARGYFLRVLRKFTLRLAADIWWLLFVILRDASIFLVLFLGVSLFWPGAYQDYPVAVPFQLLAIDFFAFALVLILIKDTDEEPKWNNILTWLVLIGGMLYMFGTVFVTESAVALAVLPPTVSLSASNPWGFMNTYFNSENDPALSIYSFYVCLALLVIAGGIAVSASFTRAANEPKQEIRVQPNPIIKQPAPPTQQGK